MTSQNAQLNASDDEDVNSIASSLLSSTQATNILDQLGNELVGIRPHTRTEFGEDGQPIYAGPERCYYKYQAYIETAINQKRNIA
jgi:hypothetical protein